MDLLSEDISKMPRAVGMAHVRMSQEVPPWSTVTLGAISCSCSRRQRAQMEPHPREVGSRTSWHRAASSWLPGCIQLAEAAAQSPGKVKAARETQVPCGPGSSGSVCAGTWIQPLQGFSAPVQAVFADSWEQICITISYPLIRGLITC